MKTYQEIKAHLDEIEAIGLKPGDWVWLKALDGKPRQEAQLRRPLAMVILVKVTPENEADDGLSAVTIRTISAHARAVARCPSYNLPFIFDSIQ
jgi:hypothetical protein